MIYNASDYQYVDVNGIDINGHILPNRDIHEGQEDWEVPEMLKREDIAFIEEARCERLDMSGKDYAQNAIPDAPTSSILTNANSAFAGMFDGTFYNRELFTEGASSKISGSNIATTYGEAIKVTTGHTPAQFEDTITADELRKLFCDIRTLKTCGKFCWLKSGYDVSTSCIAKAVSRYDGYNRTAYAYGGSYSGTHTIMYPYGTPNMGNRIIGNPEAVAMMDCPTTNILGSVDAMSFIPLYCDIYATKSLGHGGTIYGNTQTSGGQATKIEGHLEDGWYGSSINEFGDIGASMRITSDMVFEKPKGNILFLILQFLCTGYYQDTKYWIKKIPASSLEIGDDYVKLPNSYINASAMESIFNQANPPQNPSFDKYKSVEMYRPFFVTEPKTEINSLNWNWTPSN